MTEGRYSLRADMMTLDGQFLLVKMPPPGGHPMKCAWVLDANAKPAGLYWSDGLTWLPMSGSGPTGPSGTIAVGAVSTLAPGSPAVVVDSGTPSAAIFNFGIPAGNIGGPGTAATVAVGTVSTGAAGSSATVTNVGTSAAAILNFAIPQGAAGAAGVDAFGAPTSRTLALATAYQATTTTKPATVTINLTSTANFSLLGGTTNSADILIGSTNAVASGTGTVIGKYSNSSTGTIAVGLNMNTVMANAYTLSLPTGWFFAIRQTSGTMTITSAFDQAVG